MRGFRPLDYILHHFRPCVNDVWSFLLSDWNRKRRLEGFAICYCGKVFSALRGGKSLHTQVGKVISTNDRARGATAEMAYFEWKTSRFLIKKRRFFARFEAFFIKIYLSIEFFQQLIICMFFSTWLLGIPTPPIARVTRYNYPCTTAVLGLLLIIFR